MKKILYISLLILLSIVTLSAQNIYKITSKCPNSSGLYGSVAINTAGTITATPCANRSFNLNKHLSLRHNSTDLFPYGAALDIISNWSTDDALNSNDNLYSEFNLTTPNTNGSYQNALLFSTLPSNTLINSFINLNSQVFRTTGNGQTHDVQAVHGEVDFRTGKFISGLYGVLGSVSTQDITNTGNPTYGITGVWAQAGSSNSLLQGDITDIRAGGSSVANTTGRSYATLLLSKPTITGSTWSTVQPTIIRYDSSLNVPAFTVDLNGQLRVVNPVTPVNAADTCDAGSIRWDTNYIYICVATNTWKRSAIATW